MRIVRRIFSELLTRMMLFGLSILLVIAAIVVSYYMLKHILFIPVFNN